MSTSSDLASSFGHVFDAAAKNGICVCIYEASTAWAQRLSTHQSYLRMSKAYTIDIETIYLWLIDKMFGTTVRNKLEDWYRPDPGNPMIDLCLGMIAEILRAAIGFYMIKFQYYHDILVS